MHGLRFVAVLSIFVADVTYRALYNHMEICSTVSSLQVSDLAARFPEAVLEGLLAVNDGLSKSARRDLLERLSYRS